MHAGAPLFSSPYRNACPACPQMTHLPTWFKALVYSEVFLQLPFFFLASYAYLSEC